MTERPLIVVGTGRCGSTLLSHMVRKHPALLSVSETFSFVTDLGGRIERAFPIVPITGRHFWSILADPQPRQLTLLANDLQMPEVIYPWSRGRFTSNNLPPILQAMLPHLDLEAPDRLFDELEAEVTAWGDASGTDHYRRLFQNLCARYGKQQWVERSGGSLRVVERLTETFPEAAIVHLVRDGRNTALSMSRHIGFRMAILCGLQTDSLGVDPYECADRSDEADLSDELADTLPENFSADAFNRFDLPAALCGHYWSGEIISGLKALEKVPSESLLTLRFEDILSDPTTALVRLSEFAGLEPSNDWVEASKALVRKIPPRWTQLGSAAQRDLSEACQPGFAALAANGIEYRIGSEPTSLGAK